MSLTRNVCCPSTPTKTAGFAKVQPHFRALFPNNRYNRTLLLVHGKQNTNPLETTLVVYRPKGLGKLSDRWSLSTGIVTFAPRVTFRSIAFRQQ